MKSVEFDWGFRRRRGHIIEGAVNAGLKAMPLWWKPAYAAPEARDACRVHAPAGSVHLSVAGVGTGVDRLELDGSGAEGVRGGMRLAHRTRTVVRFVAEAEKE